MASPRTVSRKFDEPIAKSPPRWFAAPPSARPLRLDVPSAFATAMISPVVVSTIRAAIATVALPFFVPTSPTPNLPPPHAPAPIFIPLSSIPNLVIEPRMMYFTPSALPILATCAADGSARSLFEKFCSAMITSRRLRSMTR